MSIRRTVGVAAAAASLVVAACGGGGLRSTITAEPGAMAVLSMTVAVRCPGPPAQKVAVFSVWVDGTRSHEVLLFPGIGLTRYDSLLGPLTGGRHAAEVRPSDLWKAAECLSVQRLDAAAYAPESPEHAVYHQAGRLEHAMLAGFTHEPVVELSERLARLAPGRLGHAFYASDGASATEIALKMAFHYWANRGRPGKNRFVHLEGAYHGETVGALAVTDLALFRDAYGPLLRHNIVTPFPARHAGSKEFQCEACPDEAAGALARLLADRSDEIAALIVEPMVQGASGMRMYHPHSLRRAREIYDDHGVLLIADEIMTGFGRTGTMFAIGPSSPCYRATAGIRYTG